MNNVVEHRATAAPRERVAELLARYGNPDVSAAGLLCDYHDPAALAYRLIAEDLSREDLTYGDLRRDSERFAAALAELGLGSGDRIATLMGKSRNYLVALMGIWRLGAVHVPLFTAFAPPAIALRLTGSGARAVICDETQRPKLCQTGDSSAADFQVITTGADAGEALSFTSLLDAQEPGFPAAALGGEAPIIHIYTSGTTGNPKAVIVPLKAVASFQAYAEFGQGVQRGDVFWCAADPGWAYGLYFGVLSSFSTGVPSLLLQGGFTPEATLRVLEEEKVSNFAAAPTVYRALRASGLTPAAPLRHLRCASSAGEPLTPEVNLWAKDVLGVTVHDHYGQTEAGMLINNHHHSCLQRLIKDGSMGQVMPGWTAAILAADDDTQVPPNTFGRLAMNVAESPLLWFRGYDGDPHKTAEKFTADGKWYITGDTAMADEEGYFHFSARDDDVIIMAGYRIGPFEVESSMSTHAAVAESAVIAVPDEVRGEVIEAYVVLREGYDPSPELETEIQQWVKTHYAAHAYPRRVHFIPVMPKTPSGKIQRFVLKTRRLSELGLAK